MNHTCIKDDGGTPNRRCDACFEEAIQNQHLISIARKHIRQLLRNAEENGAPNLARRIEEREDELLRVLTR